MALEIPLRFPVPTTSGDAAQRREQVLWAVLLVSSALAGFALLLDLIALARGISSATIAATAVTAGVCTFFLSMLPLARRGRHRPAATAVLTVYAATVVYMMLVWGPLLPMAALIAALVVVLANILMGARGAAIAAGVLAITYVAACLLESQQVISPDLSWERQVGVADGIGYGTVLLVLAFIGWLYSRDVATSVDEVIARGSEASPLRRLRTKDLSLREVEVVQLVAEGCSNDVIAQKLFVSPRTVQSHVANALRKTATQNRTELGVLAVREGLVPLAVTLTGVGSTETQHRSCTHIVAPRHS